MMGGICVVARLIVPDVRGTLRSPRRVNRIGLLKGSLFDGLEWKAPVHDAGGAGTVMVFRVGPQALLDAIDGVAYVVDRRGIIRAIGTQAWERFATANGSPELTADRVIGTSLFAGMTGIAVRDVCQRLHALVCLRRREMITYEYRCDAPDTERRMRMSIRPVAGRRGVIMALYQSQLLDETPRLPSGLLSMDPRAVEPIRGWQPTRW